MRNKFKAGDTCTKTATYSQFREKNEVCIGPAYYPSWKDLRSRQQSRDCYFSEADVDVPGQTENS